MELNKFIEKYIEKTGYGMDMWSKEENAVMTTVAEILDEHESELKKPKLNKNMQERLGLDVVNGTHVI